MVFRVKNNPSVRPVPFAVSARHRGDPPCGGLGDTLESADQAASAGDAVHPNRDNGQESDPPPSSPAPPNDQAPCSPGPLQHAPPLRPRFRAASAGVPGLASWTDGEDAPLASGPVTECAATVTGAHARRGLRKRPRGRLPPVGGRRNRRVHGPTCSALPPRDPLPRRASASSGDEQRTDSPPPPTTASSPPTAPPCQNQELLRRTGASLAEGQLDGGANGGNGDSDRSFSRQRSLPKLRLGTSEVHRLRSRGSSLWSVDLLPPIASTFGGAPAASATVAQPT